MQPHNPNRLIHQKSPYLLQHAHNPVDWYPWSAEAFEAAREQDKPIFLSIGYATCHWCHVMEKESFENNDVAKMMNETFINIKVDREELPEVDSLYMEFAQGMMSGAAGWPLNVILTPELQPFFAATYLPPHHKHGLMGMTDLITRIKEVWHGDERESVLAQAAQVVEVFAGSIHLQGDEMPEKEEVDEVADVLFKFADPVFGGMKGIPKFPISYQYNFLLRYAKRTNDSRGLFFVERTLEMMHRGGIYDHLGGGFSRYSVDEEWLIPHFEKMLYDNALLSFTYLEAWKATKKETYKEVTQEVLDYILREMKHPKGGFYSAEDADTDGHEGLFYTWTLDEINQLLKGQEAKLFCQFYGVTEAGNFDGRNVLHTKVPLKEFAANLGLDYQDLSLRLNEAKQILWRARNERSHPLKDDKILSSWNGLMIYSMIEAGLAFQERKYIDAAIKAAKFIKSHMWQNGQLLRRWRDDEASFNAGLDEYAFLIKGVLSLFEADAGNEWLEWALEMTEILQEKFKSPEGAFYQTDGMDQNIILRKCQFSDGAEPSGNAVHTENLLRLYHITSNEKYLNQAKDILKAVSTYLESYSPGYSYHMMNLDTYYDKHAVAIVVALNEMQENQEKIQQLISKAFIPHKVIIWKRVDDEQLVELLPFVKPQVPLEGKTTLYICHQGVCQKPLTDFNEMASAINRL